MKTISMITGIWLAVGLTQFSWAQSTTGGRSGGSTASTGTGYLTEGKRVSTSNAQSMTIADEGASRAYMYVPPTAGPKPKNRSASPDGSTHSSANTPAPQPASTRSAKQPGQTSSTHP